MIGTWSFASWRTWSGIWSSLPAIARSTWTVTAANYARLDPTVVLHVLRLDVRDVEKFRDEVLRAMGPDSHKSLESKA